MLDRLQEMGYLLLAWYGRNQQWFCVGTVSTYCLLENGTGLPVVMHTVRIHHS